MNVKLNFTRGERAINGLAIFFVCASFIQVIFGSTLTTSEGLVGRWIASVICFNTMHVGMTYVNILMIPEYKKIVFEHLKLNYLKQLTIFFLIYGLFWIGHEYGFHKEIKPIRILVILMSLYIPIMHAKRQTLGLSLILNLKFQRALSTHGLPFIGNDLRSRKAEHASVNLMIFALFIFGVSKYSDQLALTKIPSDYFKQASLILFGIALLTFGFSVYLLKHREFILPKSMFLFRHMSTWLWCYTPISSMAAVSIHGLEYLELQTRTFNRSRISKGLFRFYLGLLIAFCAIKYYLDYPVAQLGFSYGNMNWVTQCTLLLGATLAYLHFYLDSVIYKLNDPIIRSEILPLLIEKPEKLKLDLLQNNIAA